MIIEKASGKNYYEMKGLTLGKIEAIRGALRSAKARGDITIVADEVLDELDNQFQKNEDLRFENMYK